MNLSKIYLRYYPPGLALGYCSASGVETLQHIDLLELNINSNSDNIARSIILKQQQQNPKSHQFVGNDITKCRSGNNNDGNVVLLTKDIRGKNTVTENLTHQQSMATETAQIISTVSVADTCTTTNFTLAASSNCAPSNISAYTGTLQQAILKLQRRLDEPTMKKFYQHRRIAQLLPLTNVSFDRDGARFLTGSYDRTCRIINTCTGREEHALRGHDNVVFAVAFNQPKCKKVVTGSFDGTAKIWNTSTGLYRATLYGHTAELVSVEFDPVQSATVATASMDCTARLFDVETALEVQTLGHHGAEVIASRFSRCGNLLLTGSFDATAAIWDIRSKRVIAQLSGHTAELSNCVWNFSCDLVATSSLDHTARVWDVRRLDQSLHHISDHSEEVLDVAFDAPGRLLATSSSDCTARVWNVRNSLEMHSMMAGHSDEVSKVCFSPSGSLLLTASADHSARLWFTATGQCSQVLAGHESEVFSCAFSYTGDTIVTASKDNTCRLWR